jgi:hypothetical protein
MKRGFILLVASVLITGCRPNKPVQRIGELQALIGRTSGVVYNTLGDPQPGDSTVLHYYDVMVRSEVDAKPRQRTVLITVDHDTVVSVRLE